MPGELRAQDAAEVRLGRTVWRAVVVSQVEVGHAHLEGATDDGAVFVRRLVAAEVLPESNGERREQQTALPAAAVDHPSTLTSPRETGEASLRPDPLRALPPCNLRTS